MPLLDQARIALQERLSRPLIVAVLRVEDDDVADLVGLSKCCTIHQALPPIRLIKLCVCCNIQIH